MESQLSTLLGISSEVECLGHTVILGLTLRTCHMVRSSCPISRSHPQSTRVPLSPHPPQHLFFPVLFVVAMLTAVTWGLIVVLICLRSTFLTHHSLFLTPLPSPILPTGSGHRAARTIAFVSYRGIREARGSTFPTWETCGADSPRYAHGRVKAPGSTCR